MAAAVDNFIDWLGNKLKDLNTDESVFGSYITGILDCDDSIEEKTEALQGILSEIIENENNITQVCNEIIEMYVKFKPKQASGNNAAIEDVEVKLAKMLESQCLATTKQREYTAEEKKIREAILSQYSQMSDEEDEQNNICTTEHKESLEKNTNALSVHQAERERREQAKLDSQRKKEKDKEDREKQKQMKEEKKEKRKTVKGERRR
ncbi:coiled-coil domain-containing protein 43 [Onthophagus taurus]|uniref:coiled-coil domain-containing protein 43 n=1 Tax=Onthophagus taurus TaxID=166361 RepID=UPI000C2026FB|nr:coiled-coil domain-containing protein 43 [Onthophagus taurus]